MNRERNRKSVGEVHEDGGLEEPDNPVDDRCSAREDPLAHNAYTQDHKAAKHARISIRHGTRPELRNELSDAVRDDELPAASLLFREMMFSLHDRVLVRNRCADTIEDGTCEIDDEIPGEDLPIFAPRTPQHTPIPIPVRTRTRRGARIFKASEGNIEEEVADAPGECGSHQGSREALVQSAKFIEGISERCRRVRVVVGQSNLILEIYPRIAVSSDELAKSMANPEIEGRRIERHEDEEQCVVGSYLVDYNGNYNGISATTLRVLC